MKLVWGNDDDSDLERIGLWPSAGCAGVRFNSIEIGASYGLGLAIFGNIRGCIK
jgi:hypothetical protein